MKRPPTPTYPPRDTPERGSKRRKAHALACYLAQPTAGERKALVRGKR